MQTILRALGLLSESTQLNSNQEMPLSDFPLLNTPPPQKNPFTQWNVPQGHQIMGYFHSILF